MDNLGSHKGKAVRQLIRSAGAKPFFLPKYSPDLNPIEQLFAKLTSAPKGRRANTTLLMQYLIQSPNQAHRGAPPASAMRRQHRMADCPSSNMGSPIPRCRDYGRVQKHRGLSTEFER
jgi:hypothetical protein